ncbi:hydroxyectoine utilization dehydratase EutB [Amorphus orientalis]|uniref:Threonine dehydratase n=1 Tax=Amorphus orientalis TaxID=649198 RepID=A0AAE3VN23_9HYPH|nr:hydroxyectoine utilization dehydratase EutB [Amorphus orientalis]MDQ0315046.1 threonine dehydratase [Amorphus orientalis]
MSVTLADILTARRRIQGTAVRTPLVPSPHLSRLAGHDFLLKLEIGQPTGAFKLRGATNAVFGLPEGVSGVTCCSTGNHGRGVAYAARDRGLRAVVCMSELVPQAKIDGIKALGAEVKIGGRSQDEAQIEARRLCEEEGLVEIPPFDDGRVVAGQGTIGLELMEDRPDLDMVLVPLSGGGLAAGIAFAVKTISPKTRLIGVSMDRGAAMHASLAAGHPVEVEEVASLADSLGGGIGLDNKLTFDLCRQYLDDTILVTEDEIYRAMQTLYFEDRLVAEGACVVGIAALQAGKLPVPRGPLATIITGRSVDMDVFTRIVTGRDVTLGNLTLQGQPYAA